MVLVEHTVKLRSVLHFYKISFFIIKFIFFYTAQKKGNQTILSPTSPPFFVWFLPKLLGILWAGQGRRFEGG